MELNYAPPARVRQNTPLWVVACGLASTALTLIALHFVQKHSEYDIMSFTLKFVFPVGAFIVGLLAGIGYFVGSLVFGTRVRGWVIWLIVMLLVASYFAAQYIEFAAEGPFVHADTGAPVGFVEYYHLNTISMTKEEKQGNKTEKVELGNAGYWYRGLGILGFVLGGIVPTLTLRSRPYCDLCQRYMSTRQLMSIPASANLKALRVSNKFSLDTPEHREKLDHAAKVLDEFREAIKTGDVAVCRVLLDQNKEKVKSRMPLTATLHLQHCRQCSQGTVIGAFKPGDNVQIDIAGEVYREMLPPEIVQQLLGEPVTAKA